MLCPQKLPYYAYRTREIVSAGRYIDVSHIDHSIHLQIKTTCYVREESIKLAKPKLCNMAILSSETCINIMVPLKYRILNFDVIIHIVLTFYILKS